MAIVVLIKRTVPEDKVKKVLPLFRELRRLCLDRPGYISGATLRRLDKPDEYLVISTWQLLEDWKKWQMSEERKEIQGEIGSLIGDKIEYEVYDYKLPERALTE
ncbi:MAG: antibiotic biosynthesis monooxygenase [Nitrospira bacterium SG8_3]|nr:MAG: antibiotic biosynthesis monooxygenase [Nitrospira bacterium SG8_3]